MCDSAFGGYLTQAVLHAREELAGRSHVDLAGASSERLADELRTRFGLGPVRKYPERGVKIKRPGFGGAHFELRYYIQDGAKALLPFAQSMSLPRTRKLIAASAVVAMPVHEVHAAATQQVMAPMPQGVPSDGGMGTSFAGSVYGLGAGAPQRYPAGVSSSDETSVGVRFGGGGVGVQTPPEAQATRPTEPKAGYEQDEDLAYEPLRVEMMRSRVMPRADVGALVALTDGSPDDATALVAFVEGYLRSLNQDIEQANAQLGEALRQMCDGVCRQARAAVEMTKDKEAGLQAAGFEIE
jgi:hypothetical protein